MFRNIWMLVIDEEGNLWTICIPGTRHIVISDPIIYCFSILLRTKTKAEHFLFTWKRTTQKGNCLCHLRIFLLFGKVAKKQKLGIVCGCDWWESVDHSYSWHHPHCHQRPRISNIAHVTLRKKIIHTISPDVGNKTQNRYRNKD